MISKKMKEALNTQINAEYFSAYLYHAMAAYCEDRNFKGFANWMGIQTRKLFAEPAEVLPAELEVEHYPALLVQVLPVVHSAPVRPRAHFPRINDK